MFTKYAFVLLLEISLIWASKKTILNELNNEIRLSKATDQDNVLFTVCNILSSPEFIKSNENDELLNIIVNELGFGVLGVKKNSWASKFQSQARKTASCFSALYSAATSDTSKKPMAFSKKIIRHCCLPDPDL